ncbi:hypothetical protein ODU41_01060 [Streptococcus sp. 2022WUSS083]
MKKWSILSAAPFQFLGRKLKTRRGLNSLSYFHANEKTVHSRRCAFPVSWAQAKKTCQGLNSLSNFELMKKWSTLAVAPFQFLGRKLKRPVRVLIRLLISELMKKQSIQGLFFLLIFVYEW